MIRFGDKDVVVCCDARYAARTVGSFFRVLVSLTVLNTLRQHGIQSPMEALHGSIHANFITGGPNLSYAHCLA